MRRRIVLIVMFAAVLAGLGLWLRPRPQPNLLLITLDTTRADRLGCYGYRGARTRVLDGLAEAGVLCESAYTVAPITLPAHASLFTGLYPEETGVRRNGHDRLGDSIPTLAEILRGRGYDSAAFVSSLVLSANFGLNRGFDSYDDEFWRRSRPGTANHRRRDAASVVGSALRWLQQPRSRPFFCWTHFYDPHAPCGPHPELFGNDFVNSPYDAEVAYLDQQVGQLLAFLKSRRLDDNTLVVVVGDHGEGLGDHDEPEHSLTLYNSTVRVPLLVRFPGRIAQGHRVTSSVSVVDIFPTILDLLGVKHDIPVTGRSFHAALRGDANSDAPCYSATDEPLVIFGCAPLRSLTIGEWKYIETTTPELYNVAADPGETNNLFAAEPTRAQELQSQMHELQTRLVTHATTRARLSTVERQGLESLGYLRGKPGNDDADTDNQRPDIKSIMPFEMATEEAALMFKQGNADAAIEKLRGIVSEAPVHARAAWLLAWGLCEQSQTDEALQVFRQLLEARPDSHTGHFGLGFVMLQRDELEQSIPEFRKALDSDPDYVEAHFRLAEALFCTGKVSEATSHLQSALENDPGHIGAAQLQEVIRASAGRTDAARAEYRAALKEASRRGRRPGGQGHAPKDEHSDHP